MARRGNTFAKRLAARLETWDWPGAQAGKPVDNARLARVLKALRPDRVLEVDAGTSVWSERGLGPCGEGRALLVTTHKPGRRLVLAVDGRRRHAGLVGLWDLERDRVGWVAGGGPVVVLQPHSGPIRFEVAKGRVPPALDGGDGRHPGEKPVGDPPVHGDGAVRIGLCIDGGNPDSDWLDWDTWMANETLRFAAYLDDAGYVTTTLLNHVTDDYEVASSMNIIMELTAARKRFEAAPADAEKELVLMLNAHGAKDKSTKKKGYKAVLFVPTPNGEERESLGYFMLLRALSGFPSDVKMTIFIDSCFSGGFITGPSIDGTVGWPGGVDPFHDLAAAIPDLHVYTSTDAETESVLWGVTIDSPIEDFFDGGGDLHHNLENMVDEGSGYGAMSYP